MLARYFSQNGLEGGNPEGGGGKQAGGHLGDAGEGCRWREPVGTVGLIPLGLDMVEPFPKTGDPGDWWLAAGHPGSGAQGTQAGGTDWGVLWVWAGSWFPGAAITKYHQLVLKKTEIYAHGSVGGKSEIQMSAGLSSLPSQEMGFPLPAADGPRGSLQLVGLGRLPVITGDGEGSNLPPRLPLATAVSRCTATKTEVETQGQKGVH